MRNEIVETLYNTLIRDNHHKEYEHITLDYNSDLYHEAMESMWDYFTLWETVLGAQDPSVTFLGKIFIKNHPELKGYRIMRVKEKYLNEWSSATFLEFSNQEISDEEQDMTDKYYEELED